MAAKKVGVLIKEARTNAGLTQEQLARKVDGVSASDLSKVERGEKDLTQAQLKQIAKAVGVTQASLLNAPKNKPAGAKKPAAAKKKTTAKKTSGSTTSVKVTASEKKLLALYRAADADTKKAAVNLLKDTGDSSDITSFLGTLLSDVLSSKEPKTLHLFDDDADFDFNEVFQPDAEDS